MFKFKYGTKYRKRLASSLLRSLLTHKGITTTMAKAKYIQPMVEKIVTKFKNINKIRIEKGEEASHMQFVNCVRFYRQILSCDMKLIHDIRHLSETYQSREGGYTRIQRVGYRLGDHSLMVKISFV